MSFSIDIFYSMISPQKASEHIPQISHIVYIPLP